MEFQHGLKIQMDDGTSHWKLIWLVVTGTMEFSLTFHFIYGIFIIPLTNSIIFQEGFKLKHVIAPPTRWCFHGHILMVTYCVWFFGAPKKLRQRQEGNDPDAYAAAVKESADAVQGADGTGSDSSLGSKGTFVVWPFRSCIACCLKASFSTRSNVL